MVHQNGKRLRVRAPLHLKDSFDRGKIKRIGAQSVKRIGRDCNHAATLDETRSVVDQRRLWSVR